MRKKPLTKSQSNSGQQSKVASASRSIASIPKSKQRKRRRRLTSQKYAWKVNRPRFNAFEVQQTTPDGPSKTVVVAPESGIHSFQWAQAIVPQSGPLLRLPTELREKINTLVLASQSMPIIQPQKRSANFTNVHHDTNNSNLHAYRNLSLVCRQFYVDVVGSSLLYKVSSFVFSSETVMANYLSSINPANKEAITSIQLQLSVSPYMSRQAILMLASLPNLQYLKLRLRIDYYRCQPRSKKNATDVMAPVLARIRDSKHLREIQGLRGLEVVFLADYYYVGLEEKKIDSKGNRTMFGEVEDALKLALVKGSRS